MTATIIPIASHPAFHRNKSITELVELLERSRERKREMDQKRNQDDGA